MNKLRLLPLIWSSLIFLVMGSCVEEGQELPSEVITQSPPDVEPRTKVQPGAVPSLAALLIDLDWPKAVRDLHDQAWSDFAAGQLQKAAQKADRAFRLMPREPRVLWLMARLRFANGNKEDALMWLAKAQNNVPVRERSSRARLQEIESFWLNPKGLGPN